MGHARVTSQQAVKRRGPGKLPREAVSEAGLRTRSAQAPTGDVDPMAQGQDTLSGSRAFKDRIRRKANCHSQKKAWNMLPERKARNHGNPEAHGERERGAGTVRSGLGSPGRGSPGWVGREGEEECVPEMQNTT